MIVQDSGYLIIDGDHLFHRNFHANNTLATRAGLLSGGFYGFINSMKTLQSRYGFERIYITWGDSRCNLKRRKYYPEYKADRDCKEYPEGFETQKNDLIKFLGALNIPQVFSKEYEADDVIAYLVNTFQTKSPTKNLYILTGDKDLRQLISPNVMIIDPNKKTENILKYGDKFFGCLSNPRAIVLYLSLLGDAGDNVPGITGIGEKTAADLLKSDVSNSCNTLADFKSWPFVNPFENTTPRIVDLIFANLEVFNLSLELIDLVYSPLSILNDKNCVVENLSKGTKFNEKLAQDLLNKYEIISLKVSDLSFITPKKEITSFKDDHFFLSNFYPCLIEHQGLVYPSVEHFYQAQKTTDFEKRKLFLQIPKPGLAKAEGRKLELRPDWEQVKLKVMEYGLKQKFNNPDLRNKLIALKEYTLVEGNNWGDIFWGFDVSKGGENHLGQLLMGVRDSFDIKPTVPPNCAKCNELSKNRSKIVPSKLIKNCDIMIIAEAPGATEDIEGIEPLTGDSGDQLNKILEKAGINRSEVALANILRCRPPSNRNPLAEEAANCLPYLWADIEYCKPKVIVPMGTEALTYLTNGEYTSIQSARGKVIDYKGYTIIPTWHPAYVLRSPSEEQSSVRDFEKVLKFLRGDSLTEEVDYKVIFTVDELHDYLERMKQFPTNTFDYETAGLIPNYKAEGGEILCISLSAKSHEARVFPFYGQFLEPLRPQLENEKAKILLRDWFENTPHIPKIAHNARYEYIWTTEKGIAKNIPNLQCTMLAHFAMDENAAPHNLKALGVRFTDQEKYDEETDFLKKKHNHKKESYFQDIPDFGDENFAYIPNEVLWKYAMIDADVTHRLYPIFMDDLQRQGLIEFVFTHLFGSMKFFAQLYMKGMKVDVDYLNNLIADYTIKVKEESDYLLNLQEVKKTEELLYKQAIEKAVDKVSERYEKLKNKTMTLVEYLDKFVYNKLEKEKINLNSTQQLKVLFIDVLKLHAYKTKKGNIQLNKEVLEAYEKQDIPFVKSLLNHRRLEKFLSTFLIGIKKRIIEGRIHADLLQHGTVTGRLASRNPNLQNIPNKSDPEKAKQIRDMFIADPDYVFLAKDYSQIEFRIWAQYSQDPAMIADINSGVDIHKLIASRVYGIPIAEVTSLQRFKAKGVVFGVMYGRGAKSIADEFGFSLEEAEQIRRVFFSDYPMAAQWITETIHQAKVQKIVRNLYGRIRHLQGFIDSQIEFVRAEAERQAVNSPIQGGASDTTTLAAKKIQAKINKSTLRAHVVLLVHDQIVMLVHKDDLLEVEKLANEIMSHPTDKIQVKLDTDSEVGARLGSLVDITEFLKAA